MARKVGGKDRLNRDPWTHASDRTQDEGGIDRR